MTYSKDAYHAAINLGLARAIFDRTDFYGGGFPEEESLHTALNGVLQGATDEQKADIYARLADRKYTRDTQSFINRANEALAANRLLDQ